MTISLNKITAGLAVALLMNTTTIVTAAAESGKSHRGPPAEHLLQRFDVDQDGAISRDEIDQVLESQFGKYDANGSGGLELEEFLSLHADRIKDRSTKRFQLLDADGNDSVSEEELRYPLDRMLSRLDTDGNGEISADELTRARESHRQKRSKDPS